MRKVSTYFTHCFSASGTYTRSVRKAVYALYSSKTMCKVGTTYAYDVKKQYSQHVHTICTLVLSSRISLVAGYACVLRLLPMFKIVYFKHLLRKLLFYFTWT